VGRVVKLQRIVNSLATGVIIVVLQKVEKVFPARRKTIMGLLCFFERKRFFNSKMIQDKNLRPITEATDI
jgi:hypothetical protein